MLKDSLAALEFLRSKGAKIVDITIPHLRVFSTSHAVTFLGGIPFLLFLYFFFPFLSFFLSILYEIDINNFSHCRFFKERDSPTLSH